MTDTKEEVVEKEMMTMIVRKIPTGTEKSVLEEHFKKFDGEVQTYKKNKKSGFAFVKIPVDKKEECEAEELKIGDEVVEVREKYDTIKYWLESSSTGGDIQKVGEEKLKEYFNTKGEVVELTVHEGEDKKTGTLHMRAGLDDEASGLAWHTHTVDGEEINVQEYESRKGKRKRRGRGNGGRRGKRRNRGRGRR